MRQIHDKASEKLHTIIFRFHSPRLHPPASAAFCRTLSAALLHFLCLTNIWQGGHFETRICSRACSCRRKNGKTAIQQVFKSSVFVLNFHIDSLIEMCARDWPGKFIYAPRFGLMPASGVSPPLPSYTLAVAFNCTVLLLYVLFGAIFTRKDSSIV